jgi:hypothetical protein
MPIAKTTPRNLKDLISDSSQSEEFEIQITKILMCIKGVVSIWKMQSAYNGKVACVCISLQVTTNADRWFRGLIRRHRITFASIKADFKKLQRFKLAESRYKKGLQNSVTNLF